MSAIVCPECSENSVITDNSADCNQVCSNCGVVVSSEQNLVSEGGTFGKGVFISENRKAGHLDKRKFADTYTTCNTNRSSAFRIFADIGSHLNLSSSSKACVEKIMTEAFDKKIFLRRSHDYIKAVVVGCIYCATSSEEKSFSLKEIAKATKTRTTCLHDVLQIFKEKLGVIPKRRGIDEIAQQMLERIQFEQKLINKTKDLLILMQECWLVEGRSYETCIDIAASIVSRANDLKTGIKGDSSRVMKKIIKIDLQTKKVVSRGITKNREKLLSAMIKVLERLLKEIPWPVTRKGRNTVYFYLDDILEQKRSLIQQVRNKHQRQSASDMNHESDSEPFSPIVIYKRRKRNSAETKESIRKLPEDVASQLDDSVLGESSDEYEDVSHYIRTSEEVADIKLLKSHHNNDDSDS